MAAALPPCIALPIVLPPSAALPQTAGYVTPYKGLTLVSVHGAGHHVSYFKPRQSLQMISAWLDDRLP